MPKKTAIKQPKTPHAAPGAVGFLHRALVWGSGWLTLLVSVCFFTATYDSAQVKLTLLQVGATVLLTLWACLKITQRQNPFTRQNLLCLAPLLIYMGWMTLSFVCFPYKLEAAEEFVRLWLCGAMTCLVACEFTRADVHTLTRFVVASAWICFGYGALQIINIWLPGADLLPWHGFFGHRIFSTLANPNFFGAFIVCTSAIIAGEYVRTLKKSLLVLLALGLLDLIFTESKGAWLAYAGVAVLGTFAYARGVVHPKQFKKWALGALVVLALAAGAAGVYSAKRFQSVSFRAYTWLSAFEMVKDSPLLGTGPGSFKIVYPAYRRPQIFYIENAHNTETAHAENEYLEQAATGGVVGLALFLWLMSFVLICAYKNMRQTDKDTQTALLGYGAALVGLLMHGFVDISVHFASSGLLQALCIGAILALVLDHKNVPETPQTPVHPRWLWAARVSVWLGVGALVIYTSATFSYVLRNLAVKTVGEGVLFGLSVLLFASVILGIAYVYSRTARQTARGWVCVLLLVSLVPCTFFWRVFLANHYYSLGVALVQLGQAHASLGAFSDAIRLHPFLSEYRQFRANVFAMTLDPQKRFMPALGDTDKPRTDFERAQDDLNFVFAHNPVHAMLHLNAGQLHYNMGMRQRNLMQQDPVQAVLYRALADENLRQAKAYLEDSLKLDPVNVNTYLLLANIALTKGNVDEAQAWVTRYYQGPAGVTEPEFLARHRENPHMRALQAHIDRLKTAW